MKPSPHPLSARGPRVARLAREAGFTLIEVLVAMIVLVLGVLGAAAMTLTAVRDSKQSALRSQASALAYELSDLMRASRYGTPPPASNPYQEAVFTGSVPTGAVSTCWTTGCSPTDMAKNDYYAWRQKLRDPTIGLPNGDAVICRDSSLLTSYPACDGSLLSPLVVKLKWDEKNNNARGATAPAIVTTRYMVVTIQPY